MSTGVMTTAVGTNTARAGGRRPTVYPQGAIEAGLQLEVQRGLQPEARLGLQLEVRLDLQPGLQPEVRLDRQPAAVQPQVP